MKYLNWNNISKVVVTATVGVYLAKTYNHRKVFAGYDDVNDLTSARENRILNLKHVQVFFRHGARTPLHLTPCVEQATYLPEFILRDVQHTLFSYKVCSHNNIPLTSSALEEIYVKIKLKGGGHAGILTSYGQDQMYMLGRKLRHDYMCHDFLSPQYSEKDVYVRSTNVNRTIQSARCLLAGLYGAENLRSNGLVRVVTSSHCQEILFPNASNCPVLNQVNHAAMFHYDRIPGIKEDRLKLEKVLGIDSACGGKKINFIDVRDDMVGRITHGLPVPCELVPFMEMIEKNATKILYYAMCGGQDDADRKVVVRLSAGLAFTMAVREMEQVVSGKSEKKMCLYSTHDSLMICLLEAFGLYDEHWPPFAADLRLELYEDDDKKKWVKVLYCGKERVIRGCTDTLFSYEEFLDSIQPYLIEPDEYNKICSSNILTKIKKGLLEHEGTEVDDYDTKLRSDVPAGM